MGAWTVPDPVDAPAPFEHGRLLLGSPGASRLQSALIAALALGIPATVVTLVGHPGEATVVSLGAFAGPYAVNRPYPHRARLLAGVVLLLAICVGLGAGAQLGAERLGLPRSWRSTAESTAFPGHTARITGCSARRSVWRSSPCSMPGR